MPLVTVHQNVVFIEGEHPRAKKKKDAYTRIGGFGAQLRNLNDIKDIMANIAKQNGCNCVVNFSYGQIHKIISIDDVLFVGMGKYAILSDVDYNTIVSKL